MEQSIFIAPAQPCVDCGRLTFVAHIQGQHFSPQCPWHGFIDYAGEQPTKQERASVYASVERFVLAHYDCIGSAIVLSLAQLGEIPGYQRSEMHINDSRGEPLSAESIERMRFTDKAFFVRYTDGEGQARHCWAIWDYAPLQFRLIEQPLDQASL